MNKYKVHGKWRWYRILNHVRNNQLSLWEYKGCPKWWLDSEFENAYFCVQVSKVQYKESIVISRCVYRTMRRYKIEQTVKNWNDLVVIVKNRSGSHPAQYRHLLIEARDTKRIRLSKNEFDYFPCTYISHAQIYMRYESYVKKCKAEKQVVYEFFKYSYCYYYEQIKQLFPGIPILEAIKQYKKRQIIERKIEKENYELYECRQILRQIKRNIDESAKNHGSIA
jgi:hypothetical protein